MNVVQTYKCYFIFQELYLVYPQPLPILQLKVPGPWYTCWIPTLLSTLHIITTTPQEPTIYNKL